MIRNANLHGIIKKKDQLRPTTSLPATATNSNRMCSSGHASFRLEHTWIIEQFCEQSAGDSGVALVSPTFSHPDHDVQFHLSLNSSSPAALNNAEKVFALTLKHSSGDEVAGEVLLNFNIGCLDAEGMTKLPQDILFAFHHFNDACFIYRQIYHNYLVHPSTRIVHPNGTVHVQFKALISYTKTQKFNLRQKALLDSGTNSDVIFRLGHLGDLTENPPEIPAHKALLSAHSPVFRAMFSHEGTTEAQEGVVHITDVSPEVFKDFLAFIYAGLKPKLVRYCSLLAVAEKYQVDELKQYCEEHLSSAAYLNVGNVISTYQLADLHNAQHLKSRCLALLTINFGHILYTKVWEQFCELAQSKDVVEVTRAAVVKVPAPVVQK